MKLLVVIAFTSLVVLCTERDQSEKNVQNQPEGNTEILTPEPPVVLNSKPSESIIRQDTFKKIRLNFKVPGQYYDKIEFWEENSLSARKVIDLEALNPFNGLPFKSVGRRYGTKQYDLSSADPAQLEQYFGAIEIPGSVSDQIPIHSDGQILVFDGPTMDRFTVVAYNLYLTNRLNEVIAIIAEYFIVNDKGDITSRFRSNKAGSTPVVTQDGRFVAIHYGGSYGTCGSLTLPSGLSIFDADTGKEILDYKGGESWENGVSIGEAYNKILAAVYIGGTVQPNRYWIFDLYESKCYFIEIDGKGIEKRPIWDDDGAIFTKDGVRRKYYFKKDFQVSTLQIKTQ